jgi:hypothetical protein
MWELSCLLFGIAHEDMLNHRARLETYRSVQKMHGSLATHVMKVTGWKYQKSMRIIPHTSLCMKGWRQRCFQFA